MIKNMFLPLGMVQFPITGCGEEVVWGLVEV